MRLNFISVCGMQWRIGEMAKMAKFKIKPSVAKKISAERAEGECNIGNKMNEKNTSQIARTCHAITRLLLGELNHR